MKEEQKMFWHLNAEKSYLLTLAHNPSFKFKHRPEPRKGGGTPVSRTRDVRNKIQRTEFEKKILALPSVRSRVPMGITP